MYGVLINSCSTGNNGPSAVAGERGLPSTAAPTASGRSVGGNGGSGVASTEGTAANSQEENRSEEDANNNQNERVNVEEMMEVQRLLRLELEEANERMEKARRGRKAAVKVRIHDGKRARGSGSRSLRNLCKRAFLFSVLYTRHKQTDVIRTSRQ